VRSLTERLALRASRNFLNRSTSSFRCASTFASSSLRPAAVRLRQLRVLIPEEVAELVELPLGPLEQRGRLARDAVGVDALEDLARAGLRVVVPGERLVLDVARDAAEHLRAVVEGDQVLHAGGEGTRGVLRVLLGRRQREGLRVELRVEVERVELEVEGLALRLLLDALDEARLRGELELRAALGREREVVVAVVAHVVLRLPELEPAEERRAMAAVGGLELEVLLSSVRLGETSSSSVAPHSGSTTQSFFASGTRRPRPRSGAPAARGRTPRSARAR
jgi:hypothetical protein